MSETNVNLPREEWVTSEGTATWVVRYRDVSGYECQLMLESQTGKDVLAKAQAAISYLQDAGCSPLPFIRHSSNVRPNSSTEELSVTGKEEPNTSAFICLLHGVPMQKYTKGNHSWFAHKWEGKWCKGKWS